MHQSEKGVAETAVEYLVTQGYRVQAFREEGKVFWIAEKSSECRFSACAAVELVGLHALYSARGREWGTKSDEPERYLSLMEAEDG